MQLTKPSFLTHSFPGALEDWSKSSYDLLDFRMSQNARRERERKGAVSVLCPLIKPAVFSVTAKLQI